MLVPVLPILSAPILPILHIEIESITPQGSEAIVINLWSGLTLRYDPSSRGNVDGLTPDVQPRPLAKLVGVVSRRYIADWERAAHESVAEIVREGLDLGRAELHVVADDEVVCWLGGALDWDVGL